MAPDADETDAPPLVVALGGNTLLGEHGNTVVCVGGGVPVARDDDGDLRGVEVVVDKDRTARLLANELGSATLIVLTDVEYAYVDFGGPDQQPIERASAAALHEHLEAGEFGVGSMRPKVGTCLRFVERGGERAVISSPERLTSALAGDAGTQVYERAPGA
ncbi:amino acid kinase family protein [Halobellus sp. GM3]|uniref:amino acid kinase family protein n=1 Tax=Halobellus sp. GM3 TaxID=3458410 RepID=UPI00403D6120